MAMYNPPHPGKSLREDVLPAIGMTVTALARHIGYSRGHLSTVLNERAPVTADLAYRLEELEGIGSARVFLAAQHREQPVIERLSFA